MVKQSDNQKSDVIFEVPHKCGFLCLGPLTFHPKAVGDMVSLSHGNRLAQRNMKTFRNGLVFSSRPVKCQERVRVRVERDLLNWHGSLRVGFTNVPPLGRSLPLPSMAIPDLINTPGHWSVPVHESYCQVGSELEFWVSNGGNIYVTSKNSRKQKLLAGVDLSQPLWAMIDIYGQAHSIFLLGSEKPGLVDRRSCPVPEYLSSPDSKSHHSSVSDISSLNKSMSCLDIDISEKNCVVCMEKKPSVTLTCGHQCLCKPCCIKVSKQFGTCPLCRHKISAPSVQGSGVSVRT